MNRKITDKQREEIIDLHNKGVKSSILSRLYGISIQHVNRLSRGAAENGAQRNKTKTDIPHVIVRACS